MRLPELNARVLLNMMPDIGVIRANRLIAYFGSASRIFESQASEISAAGEFPIQYAQEILRKKGEINVEAELKKAADSGVSILVPDDDSYPQQLKALQDFPVVLYVRGKFTAAKKPSCTS